VCFTQLMGLAFGMDAKELGFGTELVSAKKALAKLGVEAPATVPAASAKPRKPEGLPMPTPLPTKATRLVEKGQVAK
jgi:hypothetical protein